MLPGPMNVKKCSACSKLVKEPTVMSGNTFGATFWTDGKMDAPMLPEEPRLVLCPHCLTPIWIDELEIVGEISWDDDSSSFKDAMEYKRPYFSTYLSVLNSELDIDKERYIRFHAWWSGNDARRNNNTNTPMSADEEGNINALINLLDAEEPSDKLTRAEILRELGRFDEAVEALSHDFGKLSIIKRNMLAMIKDNSRVVNVINYDLADE